MHRLHQRFDHPLGDAASLRAGGQVPVDGDVMPRAASLDGCGDPGPADPPALGGSTRMRSTGVWSIWITSSGDLAGRVAPAAGTGCTLSPRPREVDLRHHVAHQLVAARLDPRLAATVMRSRRHRRSERAADLATAPGQAVDPLLGQAKRLGHGPPRVDGPAAPRAGSPQRAVPRHAGAATRLRSEAFPPGPSRPPRREGITPPASGPIASGIDHDKHPRRLASIHDAAADTDFEA